MLTALEVWQKAYDGIASQDFKPSSNGAACFYRGPDGLKCAVGHLISDEWALEHEGTAVRFLQRYLPEDLQPHLSLLSHLQHLHDEYLTLSVDRWKEAMLECKPAS